MTCIVTAIPEQMRSMEGERRVAHSRLLITNRDSMGVAVKASPARLSLLRAQLQGPRSGRHCSVTFTEAMPGQSASKKGVTQHLASPVACLARVRTLQLN